MDPDVRFAVAKRIVERAADHGIPRVGHRRRPAGHADRRAAEAGRQVFASSAACARSSRSTRPAARRTSASGCRTARGSTRRSCRWRSPAGMTSAITNPMMPEVKAAVMAADVLMGHDPDCGRWIRPIARPTPEGEVSRRRVNRRAPGRRRRRGAAPWPTPPRPTPLVIFTPSGRRGRFPTGTTVLDAARSLGVDIDSVCGGRGICGRCQVTQGIGEFPKHGITSRAGAPRRRSRALESDLSRREGPRRRPPAVVHGARLRRRPDRRPAREPGPSPGRPQGPRRPRLHGRSGRPAPLRRGHAARARVADRRSRRGCSRRSSASGS